MNTIYILGYNNLGGDFWEKHLTLANTERVLFFKNGKDLISNVSNVPDLIIVDEYFNAEGQEDYTFQDIAVGLGILTPNIPCFFLSPSFCGESKKSKNLPHYFSNFNREILEITKKEIQKLRSIQKAA